MVWWVLQVRVLEGKMREDDEARRAQEHTLLDLESQRRQLETQLDRQVNKWMEVQRWRDPRMGLRNARESPSELVLVVSRNE